MLGHVTDANTPQILLLLKFHLGHSCMFLYFFLLFVNVLYFFGFIWLLPEKQEVAVSRCCDVFIALLELNKLKLCRRL